MKNYELIHLLGSLPANADVKFCGSIDESTLEQSDEDSVMIDVEITDLDFDCGVINLF